MHSSSPPPPPFSGFLPFLRRKCCVSVLPHSILFFSLYGRDLLSSDAGDGFPAPLPPNLSSFLLSFFSLSSIVLPYHLFLPCLLIPGRNLGSGTGLAPFPFFILTFSTRELLVAPRSSPVDFTGPVQTLGVLLDYAPLLYRVDFVRGRDFCPPALVLKARMN